MSRAVKIIGVAIYADLSACAHQCRYCSTGRKRIDDVSIERVAALTRRLKQWCDDGGWRDVLFDIGVGHSHNFDVETLLAVEALRREVEASSFDAPQAIYLGGLKRRSESELERWLAERRDKAGVSEVHASIAGYGSTHDYWNRRAGDFDYLMQSMRIAMRLGLRVRQRLFVVKSTLPQMTMLTQALDTLPEPASRYFNQFYYRGHAAALEEERIDEPRHKSLAQKFGEVDPSINDWRSEREWCSVFRSIEDKPYECRVKIHLTSRRLAELERRSPASIFEELIARTRAAYAALPSREQLRSRHGDAESPRIYANLTDLESKWLDDHERRAPRFERHRTHLWREFFDYDQP